MNHSDEDADGEAEVSDNAGPSAQHESQIVETNPDRVMDPANDFAKNVQLTRICVNTVGRLKFQKLFVRRGASAIQAYKPAADATTGKDNDTRILPTERETVEEPGKQQMLVVGLMLASGDPSIYTGKDASKKQKGRTDSLKSGILHVPETKTFRVVVPITDYPKTQVKYYVACKSIQEQCDIRTTSIDNVFFFPEFWVGIEDRIAIKERRTELSANCRFAAARNKEDATRAHLQYKKDGVESKAPELVVDRAESLGNSMALMLSSWTIGRKKATLVAMKQLMEAQHSDLRAKPSKNSEGTNAFFNFTKSLTNLEAQQMANEMQLSFPYNKYPFRPGSICAIHALLLQNEQLQSHLRYRNLRLLINLVEDGYGEEKLDKLGLAELSSIFNIVDIADHSMGSTSVEGDDLTSDDHKSLVAACRVRIEEISHFLRNAATAIRDEHGAMGKHKTLQHLMIKIGDVVDKSAAKFYWEQACKVHSEQVAGTFEQTLNFLDALAEILAQSVSK